MTSLTMRTVGVAGLGLLLGACTDSEGGDTALPDWSAGFEDADTGTPPPGVEDAFALWPADDVGYATRLTTMDGQSACAVYPDGTLEGYEALDCVLETPELDLYGNGLAFDLTVPQGVCDYVVYGFYQYEAWEVGSGPAEVSYTVDETTGVISDEVNSVNGEPYCQYDYSSQSGPNCCTGTYTLTVTLSESGETSSASYGWGGEPSSCYAGASFLAPDVTFSEDGWPMWTIEFLGKKDEERRFEWDALSSTYFTNLNLASYYDPADHDGSMPAGFTGEWAWPYYTFICYDNAEEALARIDMVVREWNEVSQFEAQGDPDTEGTEPVAGGTLNDRDDWADATPGSTTWTQSWQ